MGSGVKENWRSGSAYEQYVGRWSRRIASEFVDWLDVAPGLRWADVGCGTGALTKCILGRSQPATVCAVDQSAAYVAEARKGLGDSRVQLQTGDACAIPHYWQPFLGKQGAAPAYLASLPDDAQDAIRDALKARLGTDARGAIALTARAWAVQGAVPAA